MSAHVFRSRCARRVWAGQVRLEDTPPVLRTTRGRRHLYLCEGNRHQSPPSVPFAEAARGQGSGEGGGDELGAGVVFGRPPWTSSRLASPRLPGGQEHLVQLSGR